jgi:acetyl-CoA acetyltransferase
VNIDGKTAIVGIGATDYYRRGGSLPLTLNELVCNAILAAADDAGISVKQIDGFSYYSKGFDTNLLAQTLGIEQINFSAIQTYGGNGSAGCVALASVAVASGMADYVVSVFAIQMVPEHRLNAAIVEYLPPSPEKDFVTQYGAWAPGHYFSLIAQRHMHEFGTTREHFAEVAIAQRANAIRRPKSLQTKPLSKDEYFQARMISDPLCLFDYTMECDGAVAVITTTAERARDLRQPPAYVMAVATGGEGRWGGGIGWMGMDDDLFPTAGAEAVAASIYGRAGIKATDVDVALLYDHFTPMVLLQLEDYGFCPRGESGPFVADGNIRWPDGSIPVNTHGGNLSEAYIVGMTHVAEAVEQIRGTAVNQVEDASIALVTGAPSAAPLGAVLLRR